MGQRDIGSVAAMRDEDAADARRIIARIESVPAPAQIDLDPGGEIHRLVRRRQTNVGDVAGAIARRNIETTAESDGEMRIVAADAPALE